MKARNELNLRFTTDVRTLEACKLDLDSGVTAEVFGDPENASYEWRLVHANGLVEQHSDCSYGIPAIAMRDALLAFYGPKPFRSDMVDLRSDDERTLRYFGETVENNTSSTAGLIDAADNELNALRRDAARYRELREHWVRIEDGTIVHRAGGLDLWCDKRLSGKEDQSTKS